VYSNEVHIFSKCVLCCFATSLSFMFIYCGYKFTVAKIIALLHSQELFFLSVVGLNEIYTLSNAPTIL
jgi:hypothetical protein